MRNLRDATLDVEHNSSYADLLALVHIHAQVKNNCNNTEIRNDCVAIITISELLSYIKTTRVYDQSPTMLEPIT